MPCRRERRFLQRPIRGREIFLSIAKEAEARSAKVAACIVATANRRPTEHALRWLQRGRGYNSARPTREDKPSPQLTERLIPFCAPPSVRNTAESREKVQ